MSTVAFSWKGMPQYAARELKAAIAALGVDCAVIGSKPDVPVAGMEAALGQPITWIDDSRRVTWRELGLTRPDIFFQSGWGYRGLNALGAEVRAAGGKVIGFSDANWRGDFRQRVAGAIAFRLHLRRLFDAMIVPGREGRRLMRWYGMPNDRVFEGMYGADPALFNGGPPLVDRPRAVLFVGQFIDRKQVLTLAAAFRRFAAARPGWTLRLTGSGAQRDLIPRADDIVVEDFVQPEHLADRYRAVRFFVLPSLVEAWGLVVHEAALCGCGLILSDAIGSAADLADDINAVRFAAGDETALVEAMVAAADRAVGDLARVEARSRALAADFGPARFADAVQAAIARVDASDAAR